MAGFTYNVTRFYDAANPELWKNMAYGAVEAPDINSALKIIVEGNASGFPLYAAHVTGCMEDGRVVEGWFLSDKARRERLDFELQGMLMKIGLLYDSPNKAEAPERFVALVVEGQNGVLETILDPNP